MTKYAQIDGNAVLVAISSLSGPVDSPDMIEIVGEDPVIGSVWNGSGWDAPPPPVITGESVNAERDRRIAEGHTFSVTGYGDIPIQGRLQDQINFQARLLAAQAAKAQGVNDPVLIIRDAANVNHMLTPDQVIELVNDGVAWIEATMKVSWDMKDSVAPFEDGIPADFADDIYWP